MEYCLVCKEIVEKRYKIYVVDSEIKNKMGGFICRNCFDSFMQSKYNKGFFKVSKLRGWITNRKDRFRF